MSMFRLIYNLHKKTNMTLPYYTFGYYDFPETFLRSKKLEKLRRKFYFGYLIKQLNKLGIDKNKFYLFYQQSLINCKDIIKNILEVQSKVPRSRYGGYPNPEVFYIIIRALKPEIVIETGVSFGVTSSFILQAMEDNNLGKLYSIDLPFEFARKDEVGMIVPKRLKHRWELILGDSKLELPKLLREVNDIDVFFHDSLHTYEHMMFEFKTAWPRIKKNGILIADDIHQNNSFVDFVRLVNGKPILLSANLGIIVKI